MTERAEILNEALEVVTKRQQVHGSPENSFATIAKLWSAYLEKVITPVQVAVMMNLLKVARQKDNPENKDNYVDGIGYLACAYELQKQREIGE